MTKDLTNQESIPESLADEATQRLIAIARKRTRAGLERKFKVTKETVRRWEKRSDLYLMTLREYSQRKGGNLWLEVTFPDRPLVILLGLAGDEGGKRPKTPRRKAPKRKVKTRQTA